MAAGTLDKTCKPGRFYVYTHRAPDGIVFYVGKGMGDRAYSKERQPEWHHYVKNVLQGQYSVEIVRDNISEDDALRIEDALLAQYAETVINLQNVHAPIDGGKLIAYSDAIRAYGDSFNRAKQLEKRGEILEAIKEFELAYTLYIEAMRSRDYDLGARSLLPSPQIAPTQLADRFTKCLAKAGFHSQLITFAERYFADFSECQQGSIEVALKKRANRSLLKQSS